MTRRGLFILLLSSSTVGQKIKLRSDGSERIKAMDNRDNVANMLRKLLRLEGLDLAYNDILASGCWLQLLNPAGWEISNKGEPVSELDRAGRQWFKCHQCTAIDASHCLGMSQNYGQPVFDKASGSYECPGQPNTCDHNACSCDVQLAIDLAALATEHYDVKFNAVEGGFDIAAKCKAGGSANGAGQTDKCCGIYPLRFPFHSDGGARGCCNGKTYDTRNMICCSDGRVDISCEPESNPCKPNPCQYGGVCTPNPLTNVAVCECRDPYWGEFCEQKRRMQEDPCAANMCLNGGVCEVGENGLAQCKCVGGYKGAFCGQSPCVPNPCLNKGECIIIDNEAVCKCRDGYQGLQCEANPCDPSPCLNGGACSNFDDQPFCTCAEGYEGSFCEVESIVENPCLEMECLNGGECFLQNDAPPVCQCPTGFSGAICEVAEPSPIVAIDVCDSKPLDLIFVLDVSGSSRVQNDFLKGAKSWIEEFLTGFILDIVNVGIVTFGDEATLELPLKPHKQQKVAKRLEKVFAQENENSSLNAALDLAHQQLKGSTADRAVLVFSDFWSTDGVFPYESALNLAFRGASVFSIGLSSEMMLLYGKLNALGDSHRVFQIKNADDFAQLDIKLKKQICSSKSENEVKKAELYEVPNLSFSPWDTAKISNQFDTTGKLPSLHREETKNRTEIGNGTEDKSFELWRLLDEISFDYDIKE